MNEERLPFEKIGGRVRGGSREMGLGGLPPPSPHPRDEVFFVFAFKFGLPHQSVRHLLVVNPLPNKNTGSTPGGGDALSI